MMIHITITEIQLALLEESAESYNIEVVDWNALPDGKVDVELNIKYHEDLFWLGYQLALDEKIDLLPLSEN